MLRIPVMHEWGKAGGGGARFREERWGLRVQAAGGGARVSASPAHASGLATAGRAAYDLPASYPGSDAVCGRSDTGVADARGLQAPFVKRKAAGVRSAPPREPNNGHAVSVTVR